MILSLDLSLTSTGWATINRGLRQHLVKWGRITPPPAAKACMGERLDHIRHAVNGLCANGAELVVIERGVVMRAGSDSSLKSGMVHGIVAHLLWQRQIPTLYAPPSTVKTLATGKGSAPKDEVRGAVRARFGYTGESDDEADAVALAYTGAYLLGWPDLPTLPQTHLRALTKLALPDGLAAA